MSGGSTPNFSRTPAASRIDFSAAIDLHHARVLHALARSLSGVQMATFSTRLSADAICAAGRQPIIRFQLHHRPDGNAHGRERLLERMELREQRALDAGAGLVAGPEPIAKRLDDMIGSDTEVRVTPLDHLEHASAERRRRRRKVDRHLC